MPLWNFSTGPFRLSFLTKSRDSLTEVAAPESLLPVLECGHTRLLWWQSPCFPDEFHPERHGLPARVRKVMRGCRGAIIYLERWRDFVNQSPLKRLMDAED